MNKPEKNVLGKSAIVTAISVVVSWALTAGSFLFLSIEKEHLYTAMKMALSVASIVPVLVAFPASYYLFSQQSKFEKMSTKLAYLLNFDQLTAVFTRRAFFQEANQTLENSNNKSSNAVFFVDLDHFKQVNDKFGHGMGDEILRILGKVLNEEFCSGEISGRLGGEEFCIFAQNYTSAQATKKAQRLVDRFQKRAAIVDGVAVNCTLSVGITVSNFARNIDELIATADKHLYIAKKKGRNRIACSEPEKIAA